MQSYKNICGNLVKHLLQEECERMQYCNNVCSNVLTYAVKTLAAKVGVVQLPL